ncbi:MAG: polyphosphate polymerase domain-containing protein [Archangium sp.]|nr:polyphosphate polymerase domain-containing protein [Archangium sp.]
MREATVTENFERFEFKYWAPLDRLESGMKFLSDFVEEDRDQVNTSLYFDSPRQVFLEQHLSGSPDRIKLRVRYYGDRPTGDCFFEIKRRQGAVVTKRRAVVPLTQAQRLVTDLTAPLPFHADALDAFQYLGLRCSARPVLLVRARRQAFRPREPGVDVRLTIDRDVAWQPTRGPQFLEPDARRWRGITGGDEAHPRALVEVKFHAARPWWLGHFTEHLAPWRVSFSKYVAAALEARNDPFFTMDAA